jgi:hypothetical protein
MKMNPVPRGKTGPPCHRGTQIQGTGSQGWDLDSMLTKLLYIKIIVAKSKEVKTGWSGSRQILAKSSKGRCGSKSAVLSMMMILYYI